MTYTAQMNNNIYIYTTTRLTKVIIVTAFKMTELFVPPRDYEL